MNKAEVGSPPTDGRKKDRSDESALVEAALKNRGEWVSVKSESTDMNAYTRVYRAVSKQLGTEVKIVNGRKYLRIPK